MPDATALLITPDRLADPAAVVMGLARRDLAVVWARDATEALLRLPQEVPQVVVLDLATPSTATDGDSLQLCQRLRFLTQVPILVLSTADDKTRILRALSLGADGFLQKP